MSSYCMDQMTLHRVENLSLSLKNVANLIVDKSGILKLDTWTLYELGEAFSVILDVEQHTNFHVLPVREEYDDLTSNLQFAYDLLQRIKKLHIFTNPGQPLPTEQVIHLRCFRNLFSLELDKISVYQLKGLQNMRSTLQSLVIRGTKIQLKQILTCCGADKAIEYPWESLEIAVFSYNKITHLDSSLKLLPKIKVLDFSNCSLSDTSAFVYLETLKHLNLSHNKLLCVPSFKDKVRYSLLTLNISNNLIFDLKGLDDLINLEELNAANNLLGIMESVLPLRQLSQLRCLNLMENPITHNLNYRIHILRLLNSATFFCEDLLFDDALVGREERKEISVFAEMFLPESTGVLELISSTMKPIINSTNETIIEISREKPVWNVGSDYVDVMSLPNTDGEISAASIRRRRNHTRFAHIKDQNNEDDNEAPMEGLSFGSFTYLLKDSSIPEENFTNTIHSSTQQSSDNMNFIEVGHSDKLLEEILHSNASVHLMSDKSEDDIPHDTHECSIALEDGMISSTDSSFQKNAEPLSHQSSDISAVPSEVEEEENGIMWMLAKKKTKINSEDVILVISHSFFREKSALTNKTNAVWTLGSLESLEILSLEPPRVKINFRSYCPQSKYSIYTLATEDFQTLKANLDPIMERNTMREIYKSTMNCLKCESEFPRNESTRENDKVFCPNCGSGVVIMSTFGDDPKIEKVRTATPNIMPHGGDIYARSTGGREQTPLFSETGSSEAVSICSESSSNVKKQDEHSPEASMSSIEVLSESQQKEDYVGITDEKLVQAICTVDARALSYCVTDHSEILSASKMQESSSSGSMTGSICTAVDQTSTLTTPLHLKSSLNNCQETLYQNAVHSLSDCESSTGACNCKEDAQANKFVPWINRILKSLTGYSWNWWNEIVSKEDCLPPVLNNPFLYNYEDPSCVDHRIKLHAEFILFNEKNEHLLGSFKAVIMLGYDSYFCGFLLISNVKFYILEATGPEDADLQSWLRVKHTHPYKELSVICSLFHNQGFSIRMNDLIAMVFFGDSKRTNNALDFIYDCLDSDVQQISVEEWSHQQEDRLSKQFKDIFLEEQLDINFSLFILVTILQDEDRCSDEFLVLSCSQIFLLKANLKWYYPHDASKSTSLEFTTKEDLLNLSAIEVFGDTLLTLTFDKADGSTANKWNIHVVSESSIHQLIQGIRVPWSELFGVDLEVKDYSTSSNVLSNLNSHYNLTL